MDYILFLEGKVFIKDYYLKEEDYFDNTLHLLAGMKDRDLEKIKVSFSWLVKNRNKVKVHYFKDFKNKEELAVNLKL